jgi:hypothetical protein
MTRQRKLLSIAAAAWLAAPAVMAGTDIVKCVDAHGRVTLTDQACDSGATATRLVADMPDAAWPDAPPARERHLVPAAQLRRQAAYEQAWQPPHAARAAPLARDVATLKAARRALLLMEPPRTRLAGLQ